MILQHVLEQDERRLEVCLVLLGRGHHQAVGGEDGEFGFIGIVGSDLGKRLGEGRLGARLFGDDASFTGFAAAFLASGAGLGSA